MGEASGRGSGTGQTLYNSNRGLYRVGYKLHSWVEIGSRPK